MFNSYVDAVRVRKCGSVFAGVFALAVLLQGQSTPPTVYGESFRKGATRIAEASFDVKLSAASPNYREIIKDASGHDRYELTVVPRIPDGDTKILSWFVRLKDLNHTFYKNLLLASPQPSNDPANNLYWLRPDPYAPVPPRARRIVKVEGFYVDYQIKDFHFNPPESPYLDSMTVQFHFSNADPRIENKP